MFIIVKNNPLSFYKSGLHMSKHIVAMEEKLCHQFINKYNLTNHQVVRLNGDLTVYDKSTFYLLEHNMFDQPKIFGQTKRGL